MQKGVCVSGSADRSARIWLLYLQGRLSPVQLLALCKLPVENKKDKEHRAQPTIALPRIASGVE